MIRIVCPFCHSPLNASELETATLADRVCLVCPECEHVLLMDDDAQAEAHVPEGGEKLLRIKDAIRVATVYHHRIPQL